MALPPVAFVTVTLAAANALSAQASMTANTARQRSKALFPDGAAPTRDLLRFINLLCLVGSGLKGLPAVRKPSVLFAEGRLSPISGSNLHIFLSFSEITLAVLRKAAIGA